MCLPFEARQCCMRRGIDITMQWIFCCWMVFQWCWRAPIRSPLVWTLWTWWSILLPSMSQKGSIRVVSGVMAGPITILTRFCCKNCCPCPFGLPVPSDQHWHNIWSPTVQVTVHQLPPDCLAVHGPSVLSLGRSGSSRSGLGSVLGVITADGSIMSGRRHPRCSMSRPVGSGSSDPHTPLETINGGAEHLQGGGDTLDRNTGVHHPNVEVSVFFVKA